ncbi:hypothetical protein [Natrinema ejinorense]|uniref:Uncharacterized protein n=1 Tax=Natrinema ejinorense TaxID=373386 RepID=A0A2A5QR88_9EURY|nr:hypothetical protein [Natrinema ejinorense]PCR89305.1 hypothetical protein CP557_01390 [Natrinema ejinorense]
MLSFRGQTRRRAKRLTTQLASSPTLPLLGLTKTVETVVAGGPTLSWAAYSLGVTLVWIFADDIQQGMEDLGEAAQDVVDEGASEAD